MIWLDDHQMTKIFLIRGRKFSHVFLIQNLRVKFWKIFFSITSTEQNHLLVYDKTDVFDQNILLHPRHLHFFVSTRPEYSIASLTPPFLCTYSTRIFYRILDISISTYLLDQNTLAHLFLRINLTKIFLRTLDTSFSTYLLNQNILAHPWHLHFFVPTRPEYSIASLTPPFIRIYSTRIFYRILDISISTYLLDQNILSHPRDLHFYVSTGLY